MRTLLIATGLVLAAAAPAAAQTPTASQLERDVLVGADLWDRTPRMLAAGLGFTNIVGVPGLSTDDLAASERRVRAAGGTWNTPSCESPPLAAYTSASTPRQVASTFGRPTTFSDGLPVEFSWPIRPSTLDPTDFMVELTDGTRVVPQLASVYPNQEYNERAVAVLFGDFGDREDVFPAEVEVVGDATPLQLIGPNGPVSAVGLSASSSVSPYERGPELAAAKLTRMSTRGERAPRALSGALPNDGVSLYGRAARFRLRVYTTGGFSPDGVRPVLPTDFARHFRLRARGAGGRPVRLTRTGVDYRLGGGTVRILGLADLGRKAAAYDDCYREDKDNQIDIVLGGDARAVRRITHVEIPARGGYEPFYNPGGPGSDPTHGVRYTAPGPSQAQPVLMALNDPMTVTFRGERRALYVANRPADGTGSLAQLSVAVPGGLPSPLTPPTVAADPEPQHVAVTSDGRFAYASAAGPGRVDAYRVRAADGTLVPLGGVPAAPGSHGVVVTPDDRSVYVANQEPGTVSQYDVGADGALTAKTPASVPAGAGASGVAVAPDGRSVFVTNLDAGTVSRYGVDRATGALEPRATVRAPARPSGLAVSPDGRSLYVASLSGRLAHYDMRLRRRSTVRVGLGAAGVAITPDGRFLYTPNGGAGTASQFAIERRSGRLTPLRPAAVPAGARPEGAAIAPNGRALYVVDADGGGVRWFRIGRGGRLKDGAFVATGANPHGAVVTPDQGPVARVRVGRAGEARVRLDGTASHDPDGRVARYAWSFGDGRTATGATVVHRYRRPGRYRVRLKVTDDEGCAARRVYTGQTMSCNGGRAAIAVRTITVR